MDALQVVERIFAGLSQTPAGVLALIAVLLWSATPIVVSWKGRRNDNAVVTDLIKIMGDTNTKIADNVDLSRRAIEQSNVIMKAATAAMANAEAQAEKRQAAIIEALAGAASAERQAEILARLDTVERQMTEAVNAIMAQFSDHESRAAGRTATITAAIEEKIRSVLAEIKQLRAELTTAPRPME